MKEIGVENETFAAGLTERLNDCVDMPLKAKETRHLIASSTWHQQNNLLCQRIAFLECTCRYQHSRENNALAR